MDVTQSQIVHEFAQGSPIISCRFDPAGRFVFAGSQDFSVWRWEIATAAKTQLPGIGSWVRGLAFSKDRSTLLTGGYDGRLIWWPVADAEPKPLREVAAHQGWIRAVAVSPDGALVATVGNDLRVKLWSQATGELVREMTGHERHIYNVAFHPGGVRLVTGDLMGVVIDWDVATGNQVRTFKAESLHKYDTGFLADIGGFMGLAFSRDGNHLAGCGITNVTNAFACVGNPSLVVFDWESGMQQIEHLSKGPVQGVAWGSRCIQTGFASLLREDRGAACCCSGSRKTRRISSAWRSPIRRAISTSAATTSTWRRPITTGSCGSPDWARPREFRPP
jgi:WD40 repeat protein